MWDWIVSIGAWNWFILAALLLLLEAMVPGVFMLWFGLAAIVIGVLASAMTVSWQVQLILFAVVSVAMVPAWRHFARKVETPNDSPFLNRRAEGYVGRVFILETPIVGGVGAIRVDDTVWRVSGPDCPAGARVRVARSDGPNLTVEPV